MAIIELGPMGVKPGYKIMDESTPEGKVLPAAYRSVPNLPGGPKNCQWGLVLEDELEVWGFFEWNSVEEHEIFAKKHGAEAVKDLPTVLTHGGFAGHVDVTPAAAPALTSPVTEIIFAYFPPSISPDEKANVSLRFQDFVDKGLRTCIDITSISLGWGVENNFPVRGTEDGQTGSLFAVFVGWSSIEASMKFQETEGFKEQVGIIREIEGLTKMVIFHVSCDGAERDV